MSILNSQTQVYEGIIELFATGSPPEKIVSFKPSAESQKRVTELLQKNKSGSLTPEEEAELDDFGHIEHLMRLVKARARKKVQS